MKKVLIVDDEKSLTNAMGLKLTQAGFATKVVYSGQEALEACEQEKFDLVLLDIMMPGIDGWEVLTKLHAKNIKVVVVSNLSQSDDINKAKQMGATEYLVKANMTLSDIATAVVGDVIISK